MANLDLTLSILRTLAGLPLNLSASDALTIAEAVAPTLTDKVFDLTTHEGRVHFARSIPAIGDFLRDGKKIQAIKELRTEAQNRGGYLGLKDAKDAVDTISPPTSTPRW